MPRPAGRARLKKEIEVGRRLRELRADAARADAARDAATRDDTGRDPSHREIDDEQDPSQDPDRLMLGTPHGEELAVVPWPLLIREKIHRRARTSDRYRWWVLAVVLAGLLSSNVLFTVFVVALPSVAAGLHSTVSTITWVVTAPMLAVAVAVPIAGKLS